ncbi:sugar ABC transporter permease [Microbacterium sp. ET2]|uniref:carbohydrate ABC transporter permease n=1 Tax=Microbacterium albipurpureum TaxID=3050384 RepID=UPI00259D0185|nr:sugar ABC transporter permease [Microbacterium sp. ET2 (Ac-2212)]WJL97026.1 sugar ABC transporter permease [Microbacterium sp. ET2 (Ac-2212)]
MAIALAPALILLACVFAYPVFDTVRLSLATWRGAGPVEWVGLANFGDVLSRPDFYRSVRTTFVFAVLVTVGTTGLALVLAAIASSATSRNSFYKFVWFLPAIAPPAALAVFWALSVQPGTGIVNVLIESFGGSASTAWLADPESALYVIVVVNVWIESAFAFLLILGAMEQVPVSLYEAGRLDGTSAAQRFWFITLPSIQPVLTIVVMLQFIWSFNGFTVVWAMTRGGPGDATQTLPVLLYREAFFFSNYGSAAAIGVLGSIVLIGVGIVAIRLSRSRAES